MSNAAALNAFVADALERAPSKADPAKFLRQSAEKVRNMLDQLGGDVIPAHLAGLSADDLFDASMALEQAAIEFERAAA